MQEVVRLIDLIDTSAIAFAVMTAIWMFVSYLAGTKGWLGIVVIMYFAVNILWVIELRR